MICAERSSGVFLLDILRRIAKLTFGPDAEASPVPETPLSPREKAKQIILGIIEVGGGTWYGTTRLYKAFYLSHLFYWDENEGVLTSHPIVRMENGPGIDEGKALLDELRVEDKIGVVPRAKGPYQEFVYSLTKGAKPNLTKAERESIKKAIAWAGSRSAARLSRWAHNFSRSLEEVPLGHEIPLYLDVLDQASIEDIDTRLKKAGDLVGKVFS
ncbi:MAG TPA: hypothetical protein VMY69_01830 [Phycisphaerae bacterium]|nr:hypothetical protein [Phycisphaerae bacterium]